MKFWQNLVIAFQLGIFTRYGLQQLTNYRSRKYYPPEFNTREQNLKSLRSQYFDILVIGGGATGVGVALDAATRGLKCGIIDKGDFAGQTSSKSTKLLHGGVRYLENVIKLKDPLENLKLVTEALYERTVTIKQAPHMNNWVELLVPLKSYQEIGYYFTGLYAYHILAKVQNLCYGQANEKLIAPRLVLQPNDILPMLKKEYKGGVIYTDGQFNDARYCITALLTASAKGYVRGMEPVKAANYVAFHDFIYKQGRIVGVKAEDLETGEKFDILSTVVVNCTGVYSDQVRIKAKKEAEPVILAAQGSHLTFPQTYSSGDIGMLIPNTDDGRVLFLIPWEKVVIAGTTDFQTEVKDSPQIQAEEREFIVKEMSKYLDFPIDHIKRDIRASFSGLRPLVKGHDSNSKNLLRSHKIEIFSNGLISVLGGKWTTFRLMGEETMEKAIDSFGLPAIYQSRTSDLRLVGHTLFPQEEVKLLQQDFQISGVQASHLVKNYGTFGIDVLKLDESYNIPLVKGFPYLQSEVLYAIRREFAVKPMDILARRTRLAFQNKSAAEKALPTVVEIMQKELGWSDQKAQDERLKAEEELRGYSV